MKIVCKSVDVTEMLKKYEGKQYLSRSQAMFLESDDGQSRKFQLTLREDQQPWPVGGYGFDPSSLVVNKNGRLEVGYIQLVKHAGSAAKAA